MQDPGLQDAAAARHKQPWTWLTWSLRLSNKPKSYPLGPDCPRHETLSGVGLIVRANKSEQRHSFPLLVLCAALSSGSALEQGTFWRVGAKGEIVGETAG